MRPTDALAGRAVEVIEAWRSAGVDPADIAVLARVNSALLPVQVACLESDVPCTTPLTTQVLARTGIRTAFAYLRIGSDPGRHPARGRPGHRPSAVPGHRPHGGRHGDQAADDVGRRHPPAGRPAVGPGRAEAAGLRRRPGGGGRRPRPARRPTPWRPSGSGIGLDATLDTLDASRAGADRSTHADDLAALESVAPFHPDAATFAHWLREVLGRPPARRARRSSCRPSTGSRARSGATSWWSGASAGLFPHRLSEDVEGERRVFHVALTRAGTQVVVLADRDAPSPFLAELDGTAPAPCAAAPGPAGAPAARDRPGDRRRARRPPAPAAGPGGPGEAALRAWRSSVARKDGVPAYVGAQRQGAGRHRRARTRRPWPSSAGAGAWARSGSSGGATRSWPCSTAPRGRPAP